MIDRRPRVVVRCTTTDDVIAAVELRARERAASPCAAAAHSVPGFGTADDGVVDRPVRHDGRAASIPSTRTARAQGGATWGDFNDATHAHGLATTGGIISTTGVGGLTLGGGIGYLARGVGLSCDNLISAEVVTADGRTLVASETENEDLFWALRGGGGNFGVVDVVRVPAAPGQGHLRRPDVLRARGRARPCCAFYREFIADAPEEFGGFPAWQIAPPLPFIPEERHGETFLAFVACWAGPLDEGEAALEAVPRRRRRSSPSTSARCRTRRSTARSTRSSRPGSSTTGRRTS